MAETDLIEVHPEEEGDSDEEEYDTEEVLNQFKEAMDAFKEKIMNVYESKLKKGVKCFTKKLRKFTKQKIRLYKVHCLVLVRKPTTQKVLAKGKKLESAFQFK